MLSAPVERVYDLSRCQGRAGIVEATCTMEEASWATEGSVGLSGCML